MATQAAQQRMEKAIGKTIPKKQIKAPVPPIKEKYPIMDWKNLPFNTAVWKESERLAGKEGYKHPVRVVYNPKTMTYRTILNKSKFQVIDKKDGRYNHQEHHKQWNQLTT